MMANSAGNNHESAQTVIFQPDALPRPIPPDCAHYIVIAEGAEPGKALEIGLDPVTLGRHPENVLVLADPCVSGRHCTIAFAEGQLWVTDTGSTNGSFIDGQRIAGKAAWPISASLHVGSQVLRHEFRQRTEIRQASELASDLKRAAAYVHSLLPEKLNTGPVVADWCFLPSAGLGGDIFDYYWLNPETLVIYLLDVSGHGVGAALHSVAVFNVLRQHSLAGVDFGRPAEVLAALNKAFPMDRYGSMYFTFWYGVFHCDTGSLDFACAGHPPALLFQGPGDEPLALSTDNPPLGVLDVCGFVQARCQLARPARLYLYSDGVYEVVTRQGDLLPWSQFLQLLSDGVREGTATPAAVHRQISAMTASGRFEDDFSILMLAF